MKNFQSAERPYRTHSLTKYIAHEVFLENCTYNKNVKGAVLEQIGEKHEHYL